MSCKIALLAVGGMKDVNLKQTAYRSMKKKIITCEYSPNSFINEAQICEEIGMSRTPVREALHLLEQENLVKIYPKRGVLVTDITLADINEIFQVRQLLEPRIILHDACNISGEALEQMQECLSDVGFDSFDYDVDVRLHMLIAGSCKNRYFIAMCENVLNLGLRLQYVWNRQHDRRSAKTTEEHLQIVGHLLQQNYQAAASAMQEHLENSKADALAGMFGYASD